MKLLNILLLSFLALCCLTYGKFLLIPLFYALFFYVILNSVSEKLIFYANNTIQIKLNELLSFIIIFLISLIFGYFLYKILKVSILNVSANVQLYQSNLNKIFSFISSSQINHFISEISILNNLNFMKIFSNLLNLLTNFAGNFSMIIIFLIFLIIEKNFFRRKILKIINSRNKSKIFSNINKDIYNYFRIKTFTSFLTAILTFLILKIIGSDLAVGFAIFSFFLNFIPYIGSLFSIVLPSIFSSIETLNFLQPLLIFLSLLFTHIFIGNFLESKLMGKALNISPIVILIFLSIMGKVWGVSGMFLSVPILVVILIVLKNFKQTKNLAILLSEKGEL